MPKTNKNFDRVTVDNAGRKSSKFDMTHSYATTAGFGQVQPIQCLKMVPHSKQICKTKSVVRLAPMVLPTTSGRMSYKVWHKFVGMSDLLRNFGSFLTGQSYGASNGLKTMSVLPFVRHCDLSAMCLVGAKINVYVLAANQNPTDEYTGWMTADVGSNQQATIRGFLNNAVNAKYSHYLATPNGDATTAARFAGVTWSSVVWFYPQVLNDNFSSFKFPLGSPVVNNTATDALFPNDASTGDNLVDIRHCDAVFTRTYDYNGSTSHYAFAVNFSSYGAQWAKIMHGLGLGIDFDSTATIDVSRFFALFKAYYDSFGISLYTNYEQTNCNRLLRWFENVSTYSGFGFGSGSENDLWINFCHDLVAMYATDDVDYISAHRLTDVTGSAGDDLGFVRNIVVASPNQPPVPVNGAFAQNSGSNVQPTAVMPDSNAIYINRTSHTQVDADLLKILYKSINRQTVAGKRIAELLRAGGYGSYVDEMKSSFIGQCVVDIDVTDVNATADSTNSVTGSDAVVGEYVGKGVGVQSKEDVFEYETDEFGYWITLAAIIPESSYVQGSDQTAYDLVREQQYSADYDAVGYEIQNKRVVVSGQDWSDGEAKKSYSDESFGIVPRETRYKVTQDLLSGDFRRRSVRDSISGFSLNKWLSVGDRIAISAPTYDSTTKLYGCRLAKTLDVQNMPIAGPVWRFVNRYPWLANFDRIFNYFGKFQGMTTSASGAALWFFANHDYADNFYLFGMFYNDYWAKMLPIEDSWSTTDDNDGNGTPMRQA